jgi:molybdenum cofactor guanylyltransferase
MTQISYHKAWCKVNKFEPQKTLVFQVINVTGAMRAEDSARLILHKFDAHRRAEYDRTMEAAKRSISAIILAGGQSRRMGRDKALIEYQGQPIIVHVIDGLRVLADDIVVVSNRSDLYSSFGARVIADYDPPCGPLGGIAVGLQAVIHELAIVVACDMPFLNVTLLRWLIDQATGYDAVVPQTGAEYEPLHAAYRRTCYHPIEQRLQRGERRVISFFADVRLRAVPEPEWRLLDPEGRSLINLNTPDDLNVLG